MIRLLPIFLLPACAALGGEDGGAANLPGRGIAGWVPVATPEKPFVVGDVDTPLLGGPSALLSEDGQVDLWLHRKNDDGTYDILHTSAATIDSGFGNAELILRNGRDPSVVQHDDTYFMAYISPDGLILARSEDGRTFDPIPTENLNPGTSPSLIIEPTPNGDRFTLFLTRDGNVLTTTAGPDLVFGPETTVFTPGTDCLDTDGTPEPCWDSGAITDAEVRLARTPNGRKVYRMFYAAGTSGPTDLGFAASWDGIDFSRYAFNPVLALGYTDTQPTTLAAKDRYLLYWGEARDPSVGGISLAISTPDAMSDRW